MVDRNMEDVIEVMIKFEDRIERLETKVLTLTLALLYVVFMSVLWHIMFS